MLADYFILSFRFMRKNVLFSATSILSLGIGIACCILIFNVIKHEISFDRHFDGYEDIYRLQTKFYIPQMGVVSAAGTVLPALPQLKLDYPNIVESYTRIQTNMISFRGAKDDVLFTENVHFVDPEFFQIFKQKFLHGDPLTALNDPFSIVLSESMAKKYFGDANALGKTILAEGRQDLKVTGVVEDIPKNTHFDIKFFISAKSVEGLLGAEVAEQVYVWEPAESNFGYFRLKKGASIDDLNQHLSGVLKRHAADILKRRTFELETAHLKNIHMYPATDEPDFTRYFHITFAVAGVILGFTVFIAACMNFINLSTARVSQRVREIGVRKVLGASKKNIFFQFLAETSLLVVVATVVALVLSAIALPFVGNLLGRQYPLDFDSVICTLVFTALMMVVTTFAAGFYPAIILARLNLRQAVNNGELSSRQGKTILRKILIAIQFSLVVVLVIVMITGIEQFRLISDADLGYKKESLWVVTPMPKDARVFRYFDDVANNYETLKTELLKSPYILGVTGSRTPNIKSHNFYVRKPEDRADKKTKLNGNFVDYNYVNVLGIKVIEGRNFSKEISSDLLQNDAGTAIVTRSGALSLGYTNPSDALGKKVILWGTTELEIIGLADDVNVAGGYRDARLGILVNASWINALVVKIDDVESDKALEHIEETWQKIIPGYTLNRYPLSSIHAVIGRILENLLWGFTAFAVLALVVVSLGLAAIANFIADRKSKEIAIRKVLGASRFELVNMMLWDFSKPLFVSFLISIPLAMYISAWMLERFPEKASVGLGTLVIAAVLTLGLAFGTVLRHTLVTAGRNPVDRLHYE